MSIDTFFEAQKERTNFLCGWYKNSKVNQLGITDISLVPEVDPKEFPSSYHMSEEESLKRAGKISANSWCAAMEIDDRAYLLSAIKAYQALMKNISSPEAKELLGKCLDFSKTHLEKMEKNS